MAKIINDVVEMRSFTSSPITVTENYSLPSGTKSAMVEIWAAGDFSATNEYIIAKVDGIQIGDQLRTGYDDGIMRNILTYDLTSLVEGKQSIELSITTTEYMNSGVGVGGTTSCWVDWRFTFVITNYKILVEDIDGIKTWNASCGIYEKVGDFPLTENMFINFGMESIPTSFDGLVSNNPKLHIYTTDETILLSPQSYKVKLTEKKLSLPKIIVEKNPRLLKNTISSIVINDSISGTGDLQYALSKDKITWYIFDTMNFNWQVVDITDDVDFSSKGMRKNDFNLLTEIHYAEIFNISDYLFLAYRFYKEAESDKCELLNIKINYTSPVDVDV